MIASQSGRDGCTAVDVDILTSRRAEPDSFTVEVGAEKIRDADGNRLHGQAGKEEVVGRRIAVAAATEFDGFGGL